MALSYTISTKNTLAGSWSAQSGVYPIRIEWRVAPGVSQATIARDYGYIVDDGSGSVVAALDLRGKWLKIDIDDGAGNHSYFYGYVPTAADTITPTYTNPATGSGDVESGRTVYTAYGYEYFLGRYVMDRVIDDSGSTIKRVLAFNGTARLRADDIAGNRSASTNGDGIYTFSTDGQTWDALRVLEHVLWAFEEQSGIAISLSGQHAALDGIIDVWDFDGMTFAQIVSELVNPARGFAWRMSGTTLYVVSITDQAIGSYVPANANVVSLTLDESEIMYQPEITHLENAHYDEVIVRGEPLRVCFTMAASYGNISADWTSANQTAYDAADDDERREDDYRDVYCRYRIPSTWDGETNGSVTFPQIIEGTGLPGGSAQATWLPDLQLDRTIPLERSNTDQPRRLTVWAIDQHGTKRDISIPGEDYPGAMVMARDDAPGFIIRPRYPHHMGLNTFSGDSDEPTVFDYNTLVATVSCYTDDRVRYRVAASEAEPGELSQTKIIDIPGAHLWMILAGTVLDTDGTSWETQASTNYVRNDVYILQRIANLAAAWYGRSRSTISCTYRDPSILNRIGHVVKETYSGGSATPAGTLITRIVQDFDDLSTTFETEWYDVDFTRFRMRRGHQSTRRLNRVTQELANTPIEPAHSGRRMALVQITGGDGQDHIGDVWEFGKVTSSSEKTQTGATIKCLNVEDDEYLNIGDWYWAGRQAWPHNGGTKWFWTITPSPCCTFDTVGSGSGSGSGSLSTSGSGSTSNSGASGASGSGASGSGASGSGSTGDSDIPLIDFKWYKVRVRTWESDSDCTGEAQSDVETCDMYPFTVNPPDQCVNRQSWLTVLSGPYETQQECVNA